MNFFLISFAYNAETLELKKTVDLPQPISQGWGMTHQTKNGNTLLYITDGSANVYVVNPETLAIENTIHV